MKEMNESTLPFEAAVRGFLTELGISQPSAHTLDAYRRDLNGIAARIADELGVPFDELTVGHITRAAVVAGFASWASDHAASSVRRAHSAWTGLFDWLVLNDEVTSNPMRTIRRPRRPRHTPARGVSQEDLSKLYAAARTADDSDRWPWPARDLALVAVLATTGIRRSELVALTVEPFMSDSPSPLEIEGKGGVVRRVPVPPETHRLVCEYLKERRERFAVDLKPSDPLFVDRRNVPLADYQVHYLLRKLFARAGVEIPNGGAMAHSLRHGWATQALEAGVDLVSISSVLGHARLDTTQVYLSRSDRAVAEAVNSHPAAHLLTA